MERNNDMDRIRRIKSWKAFESAQGKDARDVLHSWEKYFRSSLQTTRSEQSELSKAELKTIKSFQEMFMILSADRAKKQVFMKIFTRLIHKLRDPFRVSALSLATILAALEDVYNLTLESIDKGGSLKAMATVDNQASQSGGGEYIFSESFDSSTRPADYTFRLNNLDAIQQAIDAGGEPEVGVCLTMIDEDDMEVMDIEATYLLNESLDELNKQWPGIYVKALGPYDYHQNFDYF